MRIFRFLNVFLVGLSLWPALCAGADAISNPAHQAMLDEAIQNAKKLEEKNLNRFSMEALYRYNKLFDSLYQAEKKDTLAKITSRFDAESANRKQLDDSLALQVKEATQAKEELRHKYMRLLRKGTIAIVVWLAIVSLVISLRTKVMRRNRKLLASSEDSLQGYNTQFHDGETLLKLGDVLHPVEKDISHSLTSLLAFQEDLKQQVKSGALEATSLREFQGKLGEMAGLLEKQDSILQAIREQKEMEPEAKTETDMNSLCRHYLDLAAGGMIGEEFECKISTDFEKRLPKIKVFPQAIGSLLNNLFSNAFESMKTKAVTAGKLYKPTLAVSTRVLPRFIQVRIKDNGTGIHDEELEKIFDYFYSLNPPSKGAGIGLAEANRIMKEMHNGELVIESDSERGTDVYLKFFTSHEKA